MCMSQKTISSLSLKRVLITLLMLVLIPVVASGMDRVINQYYISLMFAMNILGSIMIMYDWNLFAIHYNRSKYDPLDTLLYTAVGIVMTGVWVWVGQHFLQNEFLIPPASVLRAFGYARPGMLIAFSIMEACIISICFKCVTDRFQIRNHEFQVIILSGLLFGLVLTAVFTSWEVAVWFRTYLYNAVLMTIFSYLYNQSHSFVPGMLAITIIHLAIMILPTLG